MSTTPHHYNNLNLVFDQTAADTLYLLHMQGIDSQCGCVYFCPGDAARIDIINYRMIPGVVQDLIELNELIELTNEINRVYQATVMPMFPCLLAHFCLPFSPFCASLYCRNQRQQMLDEVINKANIKLIERKLYWVNRVNYFVLKTADNSLTNVSLVHGPVVSARAFASLQNEPLIPKAEAEPAYPNFVTPLAEVYADEKT